MDTQYSRDDIQGMINAKLADLEIGGRQLMGASRNRTFSTGSATKPTAPNTGASIIVGASKLHVAVSGIFLVSVVALCTGMTATDTVDFTVSTQFANGVNSIGIGVNGTPIGPGTRPNVSFPTTGYATFASNAAAGILPTGGGGTLVQVDSGAQVLPTAGTTDMFSWSAIIQNSLTSPASESPFGTGNDVLMTLGVNLSANTIVFAGFAMSMVELY